MIRQIVGGLSAILATIAVASCAGGQQTAQPAAPVASPAVPPQAGDTPAGNFLAGRFAQNAHDLPAAAAFLRSAEREDPDDIEVLQRAHLALAADGQLAEAAELAQRVLKFDNDAAIAAVIVAEQNMKVGRWAGASALVEALPKRGFNMVMVPMIVAWAEMGQGHIDKALAALDPLKAEGHQPALYEYNAALICDLADRKKDAEAHYRAALAAEGGEVLRTVQAAAAFFRRNGAADAAGDIVRRYRLNHSDAQMVDLDSDKRPIDSPRVGAAETLFALAGTLRQSGANDLALIFARLTLDLDPNFALAQMLAGDSLVDMGRLDAANDMYREIDTNAPAYWVAQLRLASDYDAQDRLDDAIHTLETVAARRPDRADALVMLGDLLRRHSRWTEAIAAYDRALAIVGKPNRTDWALYYARGVAEHEANLWPRAEEDFQHALALNPEQPDVLNYLGYSWVDKGINLDRAQKMIEKALEQRPTSGFMVDSLGWVFFRTGQYEKAVQELERAVELTPDDAEINAHLGDALSAVGRAEEARFQWRRALIYKPDAALKAELERKIKDGFKPPPPIRSDKDSADKGI
jgi:tetratricopeptide (TPR) repeat protein